MNLISTVSTFYFVKEFYTIYFALNHDEIFFVINLFGFNKCINYKIHVPVLISYPCYLLFGTKHRLYDLTDVKQHIFPATTWTSLIENCYIPMSQPYYNSLIVNSMCHKLNA